MVPPALKLVFADDDAATRTLVRTLLDLVESVEVVGEAENGEDAVELVRDHEPDVVLLDVEMPRLDGPAAAELIRALRPQTQIVLHTAQPASEARIRAARLGLPLLDKMRFDDVIAALHAPGEAADGDPQLEAAVVSALAARGGQPVVVVRPDGSVPFYNELAAELLGLPLPALPSHIDELRRNYDVLDLDGTPRPPDDRPSSRAIASHRPLSEVVLLARNGTRLETEVTVLPFFGEGGAFAGAAVYFRPLRA